MHGRLKRRYTVKATKCNNVPIEFGDFEIDESMTLEIPASAIDLDSETQLLELDTTSGPVQFTLHTKPVAPHLRKWLKVVSVKVDSADAMCPSIFRSTGNANNHRS